MLGALQPWTSIILRALAASPPAGEGRDFLISCMASLGGETRPSSEVPSPAAGSSVAGQEVPGGGGGSNLPSADSVTLVYVL